MTRRGEPMTSNEWHKPEKSSNFRTRLPTTWLESQCLALNASAQVVTPVPATSSSRSVSPGLCPRHIPSRLNIANKRIYRKFFRCFATDFSRSPTESANDSYRRLCSEYRSKSAFDWRHRYWQSLRWFTTSRITRCSIVCLSLFQWSQCYSN